MLLSLSRAIVILFPFYNIKKKSVLLSILIYLLYQSVWNCLSLVYGEYYYSYGFGYCGVYSEITIMETLYAFNYSVSVGIPPLIVFVTLVVSIAKLRSENMLGASQKNSRRSSLTIIYFTATFLVCNTLTFINNALSTFTEMSDKSYPGPIYKNTFMFFYSWLLSEIFCTVLNASLNPVLYFWRMKRMRLWVIRPSTSSMGNRSEFRSTVIVNSTTVPQTEARL
jgi:hypothetical protein